MLSQSSNSDINSVLQTLRKDIQGSADPHRTLVALLHILKFLSKRSQERTSVLSSLNYKLFGTPQAL